MVKECVQDIFYIIKSLTVVLYILFGNQNVLFPVVWINIDSFTKL